MPKVKSFIVNIFVGIGSFFGSIFTRHRTNEEGKKRMQAQLDRKAKQKKQRDEDFEMLERIMNYVPHTLPEDITTPEQLARERELAEKAVEPFYEVKSVNSIDGFPRMFEVEVELPVSYAFKNNKFYKAYAYAYVECRQTRGAIVFLYLPSTLWKHEEYQVINYYGEQVTKLEASETIEMAKRLFAPLFHEDEAA